MKKYNKPEIEALALETVDVIAVSAASERTLDVLEGAVAANGTVQEGTKTIVDFNNQWSW